METAPANGAATGGGGFVSFLWSLTLFLVIIALLPGRVGMAVGALVALGAVLFAPRLPDFITTIVQGGQYQ